MFFKPKNFIMAGLGAVILFTAAGIPPAYALADEKRAESAEVIKARESLGLILQSEGRLDEAIGQYQEAVKLRPDTPQTYEEIHIRDVTLDGTGSVISVAPWMQYFDLQGQPPPSSSVRNVTISGIKGSCTSLGSVRGNKGNVIENVTIENIDLKTTGPKPELSAVKNLVLKNITINGEAYTGP